MRGCPPARREAGRAAVRGSFMAESPQAQTKIVVPASQPMVALLGSGDEILRVVEQAFPTTDIHVRGNEITVTGEPGRGRARRAAVRRAGRRAAQRRGPDRRTPSSAPSPCCARDRRAPRRGADPQHPVQPRPHDPAQDAEPEALRRRDRQAHDRVRHRPGRHRQDLPRDGQGRAGAAGQAGQPDHPDPAGGRGGRAARLPARHAATRRSTRTCARSTTRCTT